MYGALRKRLDALEARIIPEPTYCLVELPDGTQAERTIGEWYEHRHEWTWLRITRGGDAAAVLLVLAAVHDEAAEHFMEKGDTAAAGRMTAEAARLLAEYERLTRLKWSRKDVER